MTNTPTLGSVVNQVNESVLLGTPISKSDARQLSQFIASRQGLPGSYCGLFAPVQGEMNTPYRLFTGEVTSASAAGIHILGEESLRALRHMGTQEKKVQDAIGRAQETFKKQLDMTEAKGYPTGNYCCGKCTVAYWRTLLTQWLPDWDARIKSGISDLTASRQDGTWRRYPLFYTLLCLSEMPKELSKPEMDYAKKAAEKALRSQRKTGSYFQIREAILMRLLSAA